MYRTIAVMFALKALFAPSSPAIVVPNLAIRQPEIAKLTDACVKAMLDSGAAVVAAPFQENAIELPSCRPLVKGRPGIELYLRDLMKKVNSQRLSTRNKVADDTAARLVLRATNGADAQSALAREL